MFTMFTMYIIYTALFRSLRDRLLEEERWQLAMEMSTKCGLDCNAVWIGWGLGLLRVGDWLSARDKFSHVLKVQLKFAHILMVQYR